MYNIIPVYVVFMIAPVSRIMQGAQGSCRYNYQQNPACYDSHDVTGLGLGFPQTYLWQEYYYRLIGYTLAQASNIDPAYICIH